MKVCILISFALLQAFEGFAQAQGIHLSWNGKKKVNTENTMSITWFDNKNCNSMVKYGTDSNRLNEQQKVEDNYTSEINAYVYKTTLKHLEPAATYYYQCGSDKCGWSQVYSFKTGPKKGTTGKYVIGVWSDTQNDGINKQFGQTAKIVLQIESFHPDFTLHMGDMVENGSVVTSWKALFDTTQPVNSCAPLMPVTGNHDVVNNTKLPDFQNPFPVFYDFFNLPGNQLDYSYNYGDIHFVAINSGFAQGAEKVGEVFFSKGTPEYRWLEMNLKKARNDKSIKWIILYCHYPMYSFGVSQILTWQQHITSLLDKYNVDLCLSGHRHVYERHTAIRDNKIIPQRDKYLYLNPKGTVYITNGTSGGTPQGVGGQDMPSMVFTPSDKMYNYAKITVNKDTISYDVYSISGKEVDHFKLIKTH